MGKRLTYEQRVRRKYLFAWATSPFPGKKWVVRGSTLGAYISNACTRERDAWRSAWRNLRRKK